VPEGRWALRPRALTTEGADRGALAEAE